MRKPSTLRAVGGSFPPNLHRLHCGTSGWLRGSSFGEQLGAADPARLLTTTLAPRGWSSCPSQSPRCVSVQCDKLCDESVCSCDSVW